MPENAFFLKKSKEATLTEFKSTRKTLLKAPLTAGIVWEVFIVGYFIQLLTEDKTNHV